MKYTYQIIEDYEISSFNLFQLKKKKKKGCVDPVVILEK